MKRARPAGATGGVRAFVALTLDAALRARVVEVIGDLRPRVPDLRWLAPETIHLTLRFLGDSRPEALAVLEPLLAAAAARCPPSVAPTTGLGMFPERGSPHVLWLGLALPRPVLELQAECERAAVAAGFPREDRPFRPHLTLGRWRDRARRPELPALDLGAAALDRLVLFRSELRPSGAVHTPIATCALGGS